MYKPDYEPGSTPLDPNEIDGLRLKYIETQAEVNEAEYANITQAELWLSRIRNPDVLSEKFALQLHKKMFSGVWHWAGTYRRSEKNIGIEPAYITSQLYQLFDDVKFWHTNKTYIPLETATRFHHRLTQIHPFPNGNGRHARFMANALLLNTFVSAPINWGKTAEMLTKTQHRENYIDALRAADNQNYAPLFKFVGLHT